MYAVIKTGGKQYRVQAGEKLKIEQIPADVGPQIFLDESLMVGTGYFFPPVFMTAYMVKSLKKIRLINRAAHWGFTPAGRPETRNKLVGDE